MTPDSNSDSSEWVTKVLGNNNTNLELYKIVRAKQINILLIGRTQTGKSTLVTSIINPQSATASSGYSDTRRATMHKLILYNNNKKQLYQLNIIDTPGLKDVPDPSEKKIDDDTILDLVKLCLKENIAKLNFVGLVSQAGQTHMHDVEVFNNVLDFLGDEISNITMMILTHCDEFTDAKLKKFESDIQTNETSNKIYKFCKLKIMRVGAINKDKIDAYNNYDIEKMLVLNALDKNQIFRNEFLNKITDLAGNGILISKLKPFQDEEQKQINGAIEEGVKLGKQDAHKINNVPNQNKQNKEEKSSCLII